VRTAIIGSSLVLLTVAVFAAGGPDRTLTPDTLKDKIRGGWAGKMIGVSYGAPTEFHVLGRINEGPITWSPERVDNALNQDDLYVGMTLAETMDRLGFEATTEQYGEAFKDSQYELWHANAGARRLLNLGIKAPWSGHPKYNIHANDIDFQIEADFIGLMSPGLPRVSNRYCERVGRVMNYGDGLYGGMFISGMYAAAYVEHDPRTIVEQGLACLPPTSVYARVIRDVLTWSREQPDDWKATWKRIEERWDRDDDCPEGAQQAFNIDASLNGAYIALGLLYGRGDFGKTLEIAARAGQDSDCNPSTAGGILGVMSGYSAIPETWKGGIPAIADRPFAYTHSSLNDISASTYARAVKLVTAAGGTVTDTRITIPAQTPEPAALEQWDMGVPAQVLGVQAPAWQFSGFSPVPPSTTDRWPAGMKTSGATADATLTFTGTGVAIVGDMTTDGGRADVFLDGKAAGRVDAYVPPRTHDCDWWHIDGLPLGTHTVRLVARPDAHPQSAGHTLTVRQAIVYR
jgi:hypothetical protein